MGRHLQIHPGIPDWLTLTTLLVQHKFRLGIYSSASQHTVLGALETLEAAAAPGPSLFAEPSLILHRGHTRVRFLIPKNSRQPCRYELGLVREAGAQPKQVKPAPPELVRVPSKKQLHKTRCGCTARVSRHPCKLLTPLADTGSPGGPYRRRRQRVGHCQATKPILQRPAQSLAYRR